MSTEWGFSCKQCKDDQGKPIAKTWFNRRPELVQLAFNVWPYVNIIRHWDKDEMILIQVGGQYGVTEIWDFMAKHYGHGLDLVDEYGRIRVIGDPDPDRDQEELGDK